MTPPDQTPQKTLPAHLLERLAYHSQDNANTAFARSTLREAWLYLSAAADGSVKSTLREEVTPNAPIDEVGRGRPSEEQHLMQALVHYTELSDGITIELPRELIGALYTALLDLDSTNTTQQRRPKSRVLRRRKLAKPVQPSKLPFVST